MKRLLRIALLILLLGLIASAAVRANRPPRTGLEAELFRGVEYRREARSSPRPLMIHIVEIDLSAPGIELLVTPGDEASGMDTYASTTSAFLATHELQIAINGSFFEPFRAGTTPFDYYPKNRDPVNVKGQAISDGETYSDDYPDMPTLCVAPDRAWIRHGSCPADTVQALAGSMVFVEEGAPAAGDGRLHHEQLHPHTAVALDAQGKILWLIVVDGRQSDYSEGVTLAELAQIVSELGAATALNLDGGGSTTLVVEGLRGPQTLNCPIHTRIPMRQRPVANHLGVYAMPIRESTYSPGHRPRLVVPAEQGIIPPDWLRSGRAASQERTNTDSQIPSV